MAIRIHRYAAPADKFFVNSFLVETASGVIVIDTQFLTSSAAALRARLDALGKPLAGVLITHPHPDHYNGLATLTDGLADVPVYATRSTIDGIRSTHVAKREAWTPVYGEDYPTHAVLPDHEIGSNGILRLAGAEFQVTDLGPGESSDVTVVHIPAANTLIASDLIYNHCHPWLAEHRSTAWLDQLDLVASRFGTVATVYAGHGPEGGTELFARQRRYIEAFRSLVGRHAQDGRLSDDGLAAVCEQTISGRDGWPLEGLVALNAAAIAQEMA